MGFQEDKGDVKVFQVRNSTMILFAVASSRFVSPNKEVAGAAAITQPTVSNTPGSETLSKLVCDLILLQL